MPTIGVCKRCQHATMDYLCSSCLYREREEAEEIIEGLIEHSDDCIALIAKHGEMFLLDEEKMESRAKAFKFLGKSK